MPLFGGEERRAVDAAREAVLVVVIEPGFLRRRLDGYRRLCGGYTAVTRARTVERDVLPPPPRRLHGGYTAATWWSHHTSSPAAASARGGGSRNATWRDVHWNGSMPCKTIVCIGPSRCASWYVNINRMYCK